MNRTLGSILMMLGTSIGAGMLALPIITAQENFIISIALLIISWLLMTVGAFSLLEVNLWLPPNTNLITMAKSTLGRWGRIVTWIIYLLLLYSLICAYLSGISDILQHLLSLIHVVIPRYLATLLGLVLFIAIVHKGIASVDILNRVLMALKFLSFFLLISFTFKHINLDNIMDGQSHWNNNAVLIMITAFGYAIIIPTLRTYLASDVEKLKRVILIGSLLPLVIYSIWIFTVKGVLAKSGDNGLTSMMTSPNTNSLLMSAISKKVNVLWLKGVAKLFVSIAVTTSFLGVSLCIVDFIADGLKLHKQGLTNIVIYTTCYLPPLLIVLLYPGIFISALNYAGIICALLLIILPLCMLYSGRYYHKKSGDHLVPGGKSIIILSILAGILLIVGNFI